MPLSEILDPVNSLVEFLLVPKFAYICAILAYDAFKSGESLTHSGVKKGATAKTYGVLYLLAAIVSVAQIPAYIKTLLEIDGAKMQHALLFAVPNPILGFMLIGIAMFLFFLQVNRANSRPANAPINEAAYRIFKTMVAFILSVGVQTTLGLPYFVYVGIFVAFAYFSPLMSAKVLKALIHNSSKSVSHQTTD